MGERFEIEPVTTSLLGRFYDDGPVRHFSVDQALVLELAFVLELYRLRRIARLDFAVSNVFPSSSDVAMCFECDLFSQTTKAPTGIAFPFNTWRAVRTGPQLRTTAHTGVIRGYPNKRRAWPRLIIQVISACPKCRANRAARDRA
jgi:hypothetical protein